MRQEREFYLYIIMSEKTNNNVVLEEEESSLDFKQLFQLFLKNWKWFPVSMGVCFILAYLYLWFTPSTVKVTAAGAVPSV